MLKYKWDASKIFRWERENMIVRWERERERQEDEKSLERN